MQGWHKIDTTLIQVFDTTFMVDCVCDIALFSGCSHFELANILCLCLSVLYPNCVHFNCCSLIASACDHARALHSIRLCITSFANCVSLCTYYIPWFQSGSFSHDENHLLSSPPAVATSRSYGTWHLWYPCRPELQPLVLGSLFKTLTVPWAPTLESYPCMVMFPMRSVVTGSH